MLIRFVCVAAMLAGMTRDAHAQAPDAFEVASIKPRTGERAAGGASTPDRFARTDATLRDLIRFAFDVHATAASAPSGADGMRARVRRLLEDRFRLRTHIEPREMATYDLVLARCDLRFRAKMVQSGGGPPSLSSMTLTLQGVRLSRLATLLQNEVERAVIDRTGLDGTFDVELEFAPQGRRPAGLPGPPSPSPDGPALATALQEQLGLTLESTRGAVPVLIIERAELPSPD